MFGGFRAGSGDVHRLTHRSPEEIVYLETGDRTSEDTVESPDDDRL